MTTSLPKMGEQPIPMPQLTTSRFSYFFYILQGSEKPKANRGGRWWNEHVWMLLVVDWADETNAHVRYSIQLPPYTEIGLKQGCLVFARHLFEDNWDIDVVPVDDPDVLAELQDHPNKLFRPEPSAWWRAIQPLRLGQLQRLGQTNPTAWAMGKNDILYVSDVLGLRVFDFDEFGFRQVIGECRRSPLSMLLNDYRQSFQSPLFQYLAESPVQLLGDSLLIEPGLAVYDVSNPTRPRRTGFFNASPEAQILAAPHHLVICESSLVTVVDHPGQ